jgi:hypothetical protein
MWFAPWSQPASWLLLFVNSNNFFFRYEMLTIHESCNGFQLCLGEKVCLAIVRVSMTIVHTNRRGVRNILGQSRVQLVWKHWSHNFWIWYDRQSRCNWTADYYTFWTIKYSCRAAVVSPFLGVWLGYAIAIAYDVLTTAICLWYLLRLKDENAL